MTYASKIRRIWVMPVAVSCLWSCTSAESDADSKSGAGGTMSTVALPNQLNIESESLGLIRNAKLLGNPAPEAALRALKNLDAAGTFGHSLADGIKSLSYRIAGMTLCGETDGSKGDACNNRPFSIYHESEAERGNYDTFVPGDAAVTSFTKWTDFMKDGAIEELVGTVTYTDTEVGTYDSVIVNFYRTFKADAEVQLNNGQKLYTKNVTDFYTNNKPGLDVTYAGKSTNITTGPSEEGIFFLPNGGKTFFLQRPFEITETDVADLVPYKMALAFDHNNFIKGSAHDAGSYTTNPPDWVDGQIDDTLGLSIKPGFMEFAPILARESETIMRETYVMSTNDMSAVGSTDQQSFSARLTLYYVKEDESKSIRAVTSRGYYNEHSVTYMGYDPVSGIRTIKDGTEAGTIDMAQSVGTNFSLFKGFKRLTTVGESGTTSGQFCNGGVTNGVCDGTLNTLSWVYTFVGVSEAETELTFEAVPPPPPPTEEGDTSGG
ncbi:MAG: hypothetical protein M3Q07_28300 [Pseudobdellovibrionaceae bacterium]|nr:hypothetical protein [Pseudobdellovibrionaceae bacterium]